MFALFDLYSPLHHVQWLQSSAGNVSFNICFKINIPLCSVKLEIKHETRDFEVTIVKLKNIWHICWVTETMERGYRFLAKQKKIMNSETVMIVTQIVFNNEIQPSNRCSQSPCHEWPLSTVFVAKNHNINRLFTDSDIPHNAYVPQNSRFHFFKSPPLPLAL